MSNTEPVIPEDLRGLWAQAQLDSTKPWHWMQIMPGRIIELIERIARLTSDLAAARENASQNADRYLACEKRFEEAIAQRDAANLRVEGLVREVAKWKDKPAAILPRLVVCGVIIRGGNVLLERRAPSGVDGLDGMWDLPGGKVEPGETPNDAIVREIAEELSIGVRPAHPLPFLPTSTWKYADGEQRHWILAAYPCEIISGEPVETETFKWFSVANLPDNILDADRTLVNLAVQFRSENAALTTRLEGLEKEREEWVERYNSAQARVEQLSGPVTEGSTFTIKLSDGEDGWVVAECVELPGCVSQGKTQLSALSNINDAIRAVLTVRARSERSSYGVALAIDDNGNLVLYSDYARLERERERLRNALREARSALADYSRRSMWGYESDSDVSRAREAIDAALAPAQEPKA